MSLERPSKDTSLQMAHLKTMMQQADGEWDELTRWIQADQELLAATQRHLEDSRRVLARLGEQHPISTRILAGHVAILEQQMEHLEQQATLENVRRSALMRQFDEARLALASLRRPSLRPKRSPTLRFKQLLKSGSKRLLHWLWSGLQENGEWYMGMVPDQLWQNQDWHD